MDQVQLNQRVYRFPETLRTDRKNPMKGRVVYIHPKKRFHTVAFQLPSGVVRESFSGVSVNG